MKTVTKLLRPTIRLGILSAAVLAAAPLLSLTPQASAQFRVNQDGRALDANNRVGSNGNNPTNPNNTVVSGNDIVTGNVTAGKQFRGRVPYTNARDFRGPSAGVGIDDFIRQSSSSDPSPMGAPYRVETF